MRPTRMGKGEHLGRSPGSRVNALAGLPGVGPQWRFRSRLAAYSCGGSPGPGPDGPHRVPFSSDAPEGTAETEAPPDWPDCKVKSSRLWLGVNAPETSDPKAAWQAGLPRGASGHDQGGGESPVARINRRGLSGVQ